MFQPAGVRTLLHMRSSEPVRPKTAQAKANFNATQAKHAAGATVSDEISTEASRPPTAPPTFGSRTPLASRPEQTCLSAEWQDEDFDEEEYEDRDPSALLAKASTICHQLQNSWVEERRLEIDGLWRSLETEYGFALPKDIPGTPAVGASCRELLVGGDEEEEEGPSAFVATAAGNNESRAEEVADEEVQEAEAAMGAAAHDLAAARELRKRVEERLLVTASPARPNGGSGTVPQEPAPATTTPRIGYDSEVGCGDADAVRLAALRREVGWLRAKVAPCTSPMPQAHPRCVGGDANLVARWMDEGELLPELTEWMEDLWMIDPPGDRRAGERLSPALSRSGDVLASPMAATSSRGFSKGSPSRKAMARMSEIKAMEWAAQQRDSPKRSPTSGGARIPPTHGRAAQPKEGLVAGSECCTATAASRPSTALERHLDELLGDLDEIDRIHDDICKLSRS